MFEAIHGSAPDIAGKQLANPSGLLNAAVMMLAHIGQHDVADKVKNAWMKTIEDGVHTADIFQEGISREKVSTGEFADAVIERMGMLPEELPVSQMASGSGQITIPAYERKDSKKTLVGVDVFIDWRGSDPQEIGNALDQVGAYGMKLKMITNRGVKVYPEGHDETFCTDHWRCRFVSATAKIEAGNPHYPEVDFEQVMDLFSKLHAQGFDMIKTENLYEFDGARSFSLGQGE